MILLAISLIVLAAALEQAWKFWAALRAIRHYPGVRALLINYGLFAMLFRRPIRGIAVGAYRSWLEKHTIFQHYGVDVISIVTAFPRVRSQFWVADPAIVKEVMANRSLFPKPIYRYRILLAFGGNIVASEGDEWKRHRKIGAPPFSEPNNKVVCDETVLIMQDLFENVWGSQSEVKVDHVVKFTLPMALYVIGVAAFGRRVRWQDTEVVSEGYQMTFKEALQTVSTGLFFRAFVPSLIYNHAPLQSLRKIRMAFAELEKYMVDMIESRQHSEKKEERYDLFSSLLDANADESDGLAKLSDSELMGNIFVFLIAGHETTAHTLAFALALLALYQDEQEALYQHIKTVLPDGRNPTYYDMDKLTHSLAVINETLRLYPAVTNVPKCAAEDTTLVTENFAGERVVVPVPKGAEVRLSVAGLHYNPRYWDDPYAFKPTRFLHDWPRDTFLPFSGGARSCLGRRFFEIEAITIVTMIVSRYKIQLVDDPRHATETLMQTRERLLQARLGISLTPLHVPLVFKRR